MLYNNVCRCFFKNIIYMFYTARLRSLDILEVAHKLGISLHGHVTAKRQMAHCFLHKDENPSLMLWKGINSWKCFSCGKKGDVISLVMEHEGCGFKEACQWLAAHFDIYLPWSSCKLCVASSCEYAPS